MKQLKPRDKVTQHMTRDGLTLDNQTTGESINISSREAEQDYSAAEPGGTAEKVLERAGDIRERSQGEAGRQGWREYGGAGHRPGVPPAIHRRGTGRSRPFQVRPQGGKAGG